jgi:hypothetical protein
VIRTSRGRRTAVDTPGTLLSGSRLRATASFIHMRFFVFTNLNSGLPEVPRRCSLFIPEMPRRCRTSTDAVAYSFPPRRSTSRPCIPGQPGPRGGHADSEAAVSPGPPAVFSSGWAGRVGAQSPATAAAAVGDRDISDLVTSLMPAATGSGRDHAHVLGHTRLPCGALLGPQAPPHALFTARRKCRVLPRANGAILKVVHGGYESFLFLTHPCHGCVTAGRVMAAG